MQTQHIALVPEGGVPEAGALSPSELLRVSAALQRQVNSQFGPIWNLAATVDAFAEIEDVPTGYRPIVLSLPNQAGQAPGIHLDGNGQPYARVLLTPTWSLDASRVCLEMLVNPFGQHTLSAPSPRSDQGPAEILLEVCGAFGDMARAYAVNDVPVADFCTPAFFDAPARQGSERYSYRGGTLSAPLQILRGGHLAWFDAISDSWWLRSFRDEHPHDLSLGALRLHGNSVRELITRHEPERTLPRLRHEPLDARVGLSWLREQGSAASRARAQRLRELLVGGREQADRIVVDVPLELRSAARSDPPPLPRRVAKSAEHRAQKDAHAPSFDHELRETVADELEAALGAEQVGSGVAALTDREPEASTTGGEQAALSARSEASHGRVLDSDLGREGAPAEQVRKRPSAPAPKLESLPPAPTAQARPSSIAPIAMLDAKARPEGARMGVILTGAAVVALALAIFARGDGTKPAQSPVRGAPLSQPAAAERPTAPGSDAPLVNDAIRASEAASTPVPAKSALVDAAAAGTRAQPRAPKEMTSSAADEKAADKRRYARELAKERASAEGTATPSESPARIAQPTSAIEGLFDTRR